MADHAYRTTPLNGLWTHTNGGFYHDGRFATLVDVVYHCDTYFGLGLAAQEHGDVVEYMRSLPRLRNASSAIRQNTRTQCFR